MRKKEERERVTERDRERETEREAHAVPPPVGPRRGVCAPCGPWKASPTVFTHEFTPLQGRC